MHHSSASPLRQVIENQSISAETGDLISEESLGGLTAAAMGDSPSSAEASELQTSSAIPQDHAQHIKLLFENAPVAMAMFDTEMRYLLANKLWINDFKLQETEIKGRSQYELFPALHPGWKDVYERALSGQVVRSDRDAVTQDGKAMIYRWEVRPWKIADSVIGGIMVTCARLYLQPKNNTDMSEAKIAESHEDMLWQNHLPLLAIDSHGMIIRASRGAYGLLLSQGLEEGSAFLWEAFGERLVEGPLKKQVLEVLESVVSGEKTHAFVTAYTESSDAPDDAPAQWMLSKVAGDVFGFSGEAILAVGVSGVAPEEEATAPAPTPVEEEQEAVSAKTNESLALLRLQMREAMDAEKVSRQRESRLRSVLDLAPCGLIVLDERARPIYHNAHVRSLLGRDLEEGQSTEEWLTAGCRDTTHKEVITKQWRESVWRRQLTLALTLTTSDELLKDIEMRPVSLPGGGLMVMMHDVTESRRSEEMLRSTEARFRTIVHENPLPVILTDRSGAVFDANPAAENLLGYTRAELRRMGLERWLQTESIQARNVKMQDMIAHSDRSGEIAVDVLDRQNEATTMNLRMAIVPDAQGDPMFTIHFLMPMPQVITAPAIPEVTRLEEPEGDSFLLEEDMFSESEVTVLIQNVELFTTDFHGKIQTWSNEAEALFGYVFEKAIGRQVHSFFRPSDATGFHEELSRLLHSEKSQEVEWTFFHPTSGRQSEKFVLQTQEDEGLSFTLFKQVEVVAPLVVTKPFSENPPRREYVPVASPQPTPKELEREKLLLGETHHRVRSHLQILSSMLNLQMSTLRNDEAREALRSSQNRVRSIAALHQHLSEIATGETQDFRSFVDHLVGHLRECYEVGGERVTIRVELPEKSVPEDWLMPLSLSLNEMISNALKHAFPDERQGEIQIALSWNEEQGELRVSDNGIGLPADFDDRHPSGMGMKILRVFAGQLGGEIKTSPPEQAGAEFRLLFPVGAKV